MGRYILNFWDKQDQKAKEKKERAERLREEKLDKLVSNIMKFILEGLLEILDETEGK